MINLLKNLISDRQNQLEKQKFIDMSLEKVRNNCPQTLINFFLLERKLNRYQCSNIDNSKMWKYPDIIVNNLTILEQRNKELSLILESKNICKQLEKFNQELNDKIV